MTETIQCPECGADWSDGVTCEEHFHQMLYWEQEYSLPEVHHLLVLCYYLQHPHLYSPEGLKHSMGLLVDFVARGISPQQVRQRDRDKVDSGKRKFKIAGTPDHYGTYDPQPKWTHTAADGVKGGVEEFYPNILTWAQSVYDALKEAGYLDEN